MGECAVEIEVLGRFRATVAGQAVDLGARKQQLLLAVLLAADGRATHTDALIDALWGARPPRSAAANLRQYVYRLRTALGNDRIVRDGRAVLRLRLDDAGVDAHRFTALAAAADISLRTARPLVARRQLTEALALWHGTPFAGLAGEPALASAVAVLNEQHLAVLHRRIGLDLTLGRHAEVVPELIALTATHPYQERFHAQLMLALHRLGRSADALAVFAKARAVLADDLGLDPGAELRGLEQAIRRRDESLLPALPAEPGPSGWPARPSPWRSATPIRASKPGHIGDSPTPTPPPVARNGAPRTATTPPSLPAGPACAGATPGSRAPGPASTGS